MSVWPEGHSSASHWPNDWLIHPTLPGNIHRGFSYLALSANTECIDSPGCSIKIPRSSTQYFSHFEWAWTAALLQEQWTKQMGFSTQLPPLPAHQRWRSFRDQITTMLLICENREVNRRAHSAGLKLLYSSVQLLDQVTLNSIQAPSNSPLSDVVNVCYLRFTHYFILCDYSINTWQVSHFICSHDLSCLWHINQYAACIFQWYKAFSVDNNI